MSGLCPGLVLLLSCCCPPAVVLLLSSVLHWPTLFSSCSFSCPAVVLWPRWPTLSCPAAVQASMLEMARKPAPQQRAPHLPDQLPPFLNVAAGTLWLLLLAAYWLKGEYPGPKSGRGPRCLSESWQRFWSMRGEGSLRSTTEGRRPDRSSFPPVPSKRTVE